jgi:hypothetical protein
LRLCINRDKTLVLIMTGRDKTLVLIMTGWDKTLVLIMTGRDKTLVLIMTGRDNVCETITKTFLTCPFGQLTKKVLVRINFFFFL